jgi:hypothetical protein
VTLTILLRATEFLFWCIEVGIERLAVLRFDIGIVVNKPLLRCPRQLCCESATASWRIAKPSLCIGSVVHELADTGFLEPTGKVVRTVGPVRWTL